ncbi:hypothetical protein Tco_1250556 [Tanacetum coccineum]
MLGITLEYLRMDDSYKDGDGDASFQLKSDSLPHTHTQTTKTYYKHQDSRIKKAQAKAQVIPSPTHSKPIGMKASWTYTVDYFFNNDLEYLKGRSSSRKYTTTTTKTKAAKYDNIEGIEDMFLTLWSPVKVAYDKFAMWGDFPRLNLRDIEDLLLLLVQKKLSNLEKDVIFDLNVALRMFTRHIVILKRVEDLQLEVKSYQNKLITKPETFRSDISKMTPYTAYKNP